MRVELDITRECNFKCNGCDRMCNVLRNAEDSRMSVDEISGILNEIKEHDIEQLTIIGGEPTLHPDFLEICRMVSESEFIGTKKLATNHSNEHLVDIVKTKFPNIEVRYDNGVDIGKIGQIKNDIHYNMMLSPKEEKMEYNCPCAYIDICGINIHKHDGRIVYFWCSAGTTISKLLGKECLMKGSLEELIASKEEFYSNELAGLCSNCMYSAVNPIRYSNDSRVSECFRENFEKISGK